jgi:hypothetical protein
MSRLLWFLLGSAATLIGCAAAGYFSGEGTPEQNLDSKDSAEADAVSPDDDSQAEEEN